MKASDRGLHPKGPGTAPHCDALVQIAFISFARSILSAMRDAEYTLPHISTLYAHIDQLSSAAIS